MPRFLPGRSKWDWDYLLEVRRPRVIFPYSQELKARADWKRLYRRVQAGPLWSFEFFVRADALGKLHDPAATVSEIR